MSELIDTHGSRRNTRLHLLASTSAVALLVSVVTANAVGNVDRPTFWIELGGQLERVDGGQEAFLPPFASMINLNVFSSPDIAQRAPRYATGMEGKLTLQPESSNWTFSAALRYGRSNNSRKTHQETVPASDVSYVSIPLFGIHGTYPITPAARQFLDLSPRNAESHLILDFQAGRDVGLGIFGSNGASILSAGIRFAQFASESKTTIDADPDFGFSRKYATQVFGFPADINGAVQSWHLYAARADTRRSFHGVGPSLAWDGSEPVVGSERAGELAFDWGVNASILFGRQKVRTHHATTAHFRSSAQGSGSLPITYQHHYTRTRSRSVTIPNLGGFAGFSLKFPNAKISLGYRADVFFGAIDGGIDARKTYDRAFYGPFANFSIGL